MKLAGLFLNAKTVQEVPAGTLIFEAGSSGTVMFGIVEGEVEVRLAADPAQTDAIPARAHRRFLASTRLDFSPFCNPTMKHRVSDLLGYDVR